MSISYSTVVLPILLVFTLTLIVFPTPNSGEWMIFAITAGLSLYVSVGLYLFRRAAAGNRSSVFWFQTPHAALPLLLSLILLLVTPSALAWISLIASVPVAVVVWLAWRAAKRSFGSDLQLLLRNRNLEVQVRSMASLGRDFIRLMGIPLLPAQRPTFMIVLLALVAIALDASRFYSLSQVISALPSIADPDVKETMRAPIAVAVALILVPTLGSWGRKVRHRARRRALLSANTARQIDRRAPVLFLRAFRDDRVVLPEDSIPFPLRLIDPGSIAGSLDELLVQEFGWLGPVVAIGDPDEPIPPLGVARMYCADDSWQATVDGLLAESVQIVIAVDRLTALGTLDPPTGLAWEITRLRERGVLHKTLFVFPPDFAFADNALASLFRLIDPEQRYSPPVLTTGILAVLFRENGEATLVTASRATEVEYTLALRTPRLVTSTTS